MQKYNNFPDMITIKAQNLQKKICLQDVKSLLIRVIFQAAFRVGRKKKNKLFSNFFRKKFGRLKKTHELRGVIT